MLIHALERQRPPRFVDCEIGTRHFFLNYWYRDCVLTHFFLLVDLVLLKSDEEPVDPMPQIRKECVKTCPGPLANYEACKERIKDKPGVSCEIWYYELHHCVDKCVAPKIFAATKE